MLVKVHSVSTVGLEPVAVDVEATVTSGIPQIIIIGMVNTAIKEAKDRIVTALKTLGIKPKARKTIISLTPASIKKTGTSFDLAIAVSLLALYHKIRLPLTSTAFIGEVSLDGSLTPVASCCALVVAAQKLGYTSVIVPYHNLPETVLVTGIEIYGVRHLNEIIDTPLTAVKKSLPTPIAQPPPDEVSIVGQTQAVRAVTIAVAGRHHLHLLGSPGVGKSLLPLFANALQPGLSSEQALAVLCNYSLRSFKRKDILQAPFRQPDHSSPLKKVIGYDSTLLPGEVSLSHHGVLFLDELPLFKTTVLQALRSILDDKQVRLQSSQQQVVLPANSMVLAASNPCPCGFWQSSTKPCRCTAAARTAYSKKLSWPLLERFDLQLHVPALHDTEYSNTTPLHHSSHFKERVEAARQVQHHRYKNEQYFNSDLNFERVNQFCTVKSDAAAFLKKAVTTYHLSTRGYTKLVAVAQTIADLDQSSSITLPHCAEALQYRPTPL